MRMLIAVFAMLALITAAQTVLARRAAGESVAFWSTLFFTTAIWTAWVALIPTIVWLGRRFEDKEKLQGDRPNPAAVH